MIINKTNLTRQIKQNGIFYTPAAAFVKVFKDITDGVDLSKVRDIYDPTCGTGNLFCVADQVLQKPDLPKFGQDINHDQIQIARQHHPTLQAVCADVLEQPDYFEQRKFSLIVANYPFSVSWNADQLKDDPRFSRAPALAPKSKADYAFLLHILHMLNDDGFAVVIAFPGILYRGNREAKIRRYLVENGYIHKIFSIAPKTFEDTSIPTVALLISNRRAAQIEFKDEKGQFFAVTCAQILADSNCNLSPSCYAPKEQANIPTIEEMRALDQQVRQMMAIRIIKELEAETWMMQVMQGKSLATVNAFLFCIRSKIRLLQQQLTTSNRN